MRQRLQVRLLLKMATRGLIGIALLALAFCPVPLRASVTRHKVTHAKTHVVTHKAIRHRSAGAPRKIARAKSAKAGLRNVSYKTARHNRRFRYRRTRRHHITLPKQPAPDRTEQIQSALARGGFYSGNSNGKWDGGTQEALRRFQSANGLPPTGKLDALSLQRLGLGSDVAGLSAPRPVMSGDQSSNQPSSSSARRTPGR